MKGKNVSITALKGLNLSQQRLLCKLNQWGTEKEDALHLIGGERENVVRFLRHELFQPGMRFNPGWLSSHRCWRPGWNHPVANTFCSRSCKHSQVNDQTPRWKSTRDEMKVIPGWNSSQGEITHVNEALTETVSKHWTSPPDQTSYSEITIYIYIFSANLFVIENWTIHDRFYYFGWTLSLNHCDKRVK